MTHGSSLLGQRSPLCRMPLSSKWDPLRSLAPLPKHQVWSGMMRNHTILSFQAFSCLPSCDQRHQTRETQAVCLIMPCLRLLQKSNTERGCCFHAGALQSRVLYSPDEPWSFPNIVTLAGIHQSVPVPLNTSLIGQNTTLLGFSVFEDLPVVLNAHLQWRDAPSATDWALTNLHPLCNETGSLVVLQVLFLPLH